MQKKVHKIIYALKNNEIVSTSVGINAVEDTVKSTIILDNNVVLLTKIV